MKGLSFWEAAAREAYEEAGIEGAIGQEPVGSYVYDKQTNEGYSVPCHVFVYPMTVTFHHRDWPEKKSRKLRWFPLEQAIDAADDEGLARLLTEWSIEGGRSLADAVIKV